MELIYAAVALFVYMTLAFCVSLKEKNNGIADIAYGGGFVLVAWTTFWLAGGASVSGLIVSSLATLWAGRLSLRIYLRNRNKPEDFRYKKWRDEWGKTFVLRSFLQVYMLQGLVIYVVSLPLSLTNVYGAGFLLGTDFAWLLLFGVFLWLVGFLFEALGDYQLARFLADPANKGAVMDRGLWRYTRHPNYFGESVMWWALALCAAASLFPQGAVWLAGLAFLSPVLITYLLLFVSGVPMLEARFAGNPAWEEYKKRTSVFIPLPPKAS